MMSASYRNPKANPKAKAKAEVKHTLELTTDDVFLIQAALYTVAPHGGGSAVFTLFMKIQEECELGAPEPLVLRMTREVLETAVAAKVVRYVH